MDDLTQLLRAMKAQNGFNWLCSGNGYDIRADDWRRVAGELLYAIETVAQGSYDEIMDEVMSNLPDYYFEEEE